MFKDIYEFDDTLIVHLKKGIKLDSSEVETTIQKLLCKYGMTYAVISDYEKQNRRYIEVGDEGLNFEKLMSEKPYTSGGNSKKSRMINSQAIKSSI